MAATLALLKRLSACARRILSSSPFTKYLLVTNIVVGAGIDFYGDVIAQRVVEKAERTNWNRTGRMMCVSTALTVPTHYWYIGLDRWFPLRTGRYLALKVLLDVFAAGPVFLAAFYVGLSKLEGCTWKECAGKTKQKLLPTILCEASFWTVIQAFNFYFLPTSLRFLYANSMDLFWSVIFSSIVHSDISIATINHIPSIKR